MIAVALTLIFLMMAVLGVALALGTVLARNLVHAALFLVGFFFVVACVFVVLEAEFLAAMQVLVYIGAVAILLMFAIMLTRNIQGDETTGGHWNRKLPAAVISLGFLVVLVWAIRTDTGTSRRAGWATVSQRPVVEGTADPRGAAVSNMGLAIGREMMTRWLIPFEVAGLLLTAALVGAIALAQADPTEAEERASGRRSTLRANGLAGGELGGGVALVEQTASERT